MASGIATARLDEKSLEAYLNFPVWRKLAIESDAAAGPETDEGRPAEQEKIRALLTRERGGWLGDAPFTLKKPLLISSILGRASEEQYLVFCDICDALNRSPCVATFDDSDVWQKAIAIARRRSSPNAGLATRYSRVQAVARSIRRVEKLGFPVQVTVFGPSFTHTTLEAICAKISDGVKRLGGRSFADAIFRWFSTKRRIYHGSLLYGRVVDQLGNLRDPSIPWHYLYNLALRHFDVPAQSGASQADLDAVVELARDMAAVFDVEMYTVYENMAGVGHSSFHQYIRDRVIYDELFAFQQWQPEVAVHLFGSLLGYLREKGCAIPLASVEQWTAFADALLLASAESGLTIRHSSECASAAVDSDLTQKLFQALMLPLSEVNSQYLTPLDTLKRNAPYSPFYAYSMGFHLLPPRAILARGLYEGVYTLLRKHNPGHIENWLGEALEQMAADAIAQLGHRPAIVRQQYRIPGRPKRDAPFDVDVAELTDRHIFLFECKKKALTNPARAGNTLAASVDFARGFLHPLVQANRHESQLRSAAGLTLLNGEIFKLGACPSNG